MFFPSGFKLHSLAMAVCIPMALGTANSSFAQEPITETPKQLKTIKVSATNLDGASENTGSYTTESTVPATGLNLSIRDTPQSVSVITRERIDDEGMETISDALRSTPGISVKVTDRGRNSLSARGFDINNYQFDGVPTVTGNVGIETANTAIYDRVEIIRGATGLLSGAGDPSATVNLVRKRADSKTFTGNVEITLGSWDHRGGTIDLTTPITGDGSIRARVVAGKNKQNAFIDLENTDNTVFYSVVDADLTDATQLSIGGSDERTKRNGVYWGGLPIWFSDGTRTNWDRSKTTATTWNQWDTKEQTLFATLEHQFSNQWIVKANTSYYTQQEDSNLLWVTGNPNKNTGEGMAAFPYLYATNPEQTHVNLLATGPFTLWDREHELTAGIMHSKHTGGWDNGGDPLSVTPAVGNFYEWDGSFPAPVWNTPYVASRETTTQSAAYAAARLQFTDRLKLITGARVSNWEVDAQEAVWTPNAYTIKHEQLVTPYLGLVYDLAEQISAYASYSDIFKPQTSRDRNGDYLDPLSGANYELGVKGEFFDGRLNASTAVFLIEQDNFAMPDEGYFVPGTTTQASYGAKGTESEGYELELTGELTPAWDISLSWTAFSAKDAYDEDVAVQHPRKMLKLFTKYSLQGSWTGLSVGGGINWQSEEPRRQANPVTNIEEKIGQSAYALANVMASYDFNQYLSLQLNVNNLFDETFYESSWGTFTYGEPRNVRAALDYRF